MIRKIAIATVGLALVGSSVFAQSLADAKKAIDAEQYVKAKAMLKNLTVTQPTNAEAFFQLGWVYLSQDYVDSAKAVFNKGVAADPKSALNYIGLGTAAHLNKDAAGATSNFQQALGWVKKKDAEPFLYIGRGYLLGAEDGKLSAQDANAAIDALNKGKLANEKNPDIWVELGNAYRSQFKSNDAFTNYQQALTLDPKSVTANTAIGVLWRYADSFDAAEKAFQTATTVDPNFGPAYREWAETENREASNRGKNASDKIKSAVAHFKTYMSLTDQSNETLLRYADFLVRAGQWADLREVGAKLTASPNVNPRIYRYLGYAALESKDPKAAMEYMNKWMAKADPKRVIPRDFLYHGRAQLQAGQDTTKAVETLTKAVELDSTFADVYRDIAKVNVDRKRYSAAFDSYSKILKKDKNLTFGDYLAAGRYGYFAFTIDQAAKAKADPTFKQDSSLLVRADSALSYMQQKMTNPIFWTPLFRARIAELRDADREHKKGLAKGYYEQVVQILEPKTASLTAQEKPALLEAYDYLGNIYAYKEKDDVKAAEYFNKAKALDPADSQADFYFKQKAGTKSK
nr:tetratricopeptide repeat protein [uncultured Mucilaginibacter sp.]